MTQKPGFPDTPFSYGEVARGLGLESNTRAGRIPAAGIQYESHPECGVPKVGDNGQRRKSITCERAAANC